VIFDEASQITTWDAIGAIARGNQTIIVGDPKQLPPTNFFGRSEDDGGSEDLEDHEKDLESILDEATASGLPTLMLNWHYRSRHESLIAFSNYHYYGNRLVTFPAADPSVGGVKFQHLPESQYDRGKSRTNRKEADAIVRDAVERMKQCLLLPEEERMTFGVITFNSQQQSLIQDLFDQAQRDNPELDWFFSDDRIEPTVVKNLENVQGDERDVMFFSITFGPNAMGKVPLTFGALNRDGGERRLNVAVTRARQELVVYSSFRGDQLAIAGTKSRGVKDLKHFLDYAEKGPIAIQSASDGSVGGFDSPFEEAVSDSLAARGWQLISQVGVSGFRVDLGIVHPDRPGAYLAGVECDGATYHRSAAARDRDKTRQAVLEGLSWNIVRIWSPDWWYDSRGVSQRVHLELTELLEKDRKRRQELEQAERARRESEAATREAEVIRQATNASDTDEKANSSWDEAANAYRRSMEETGSADEVAEAPLQYASRVEEPIASDQPARSRIYFCRVKLSDLSENQPLFFESSYDDTLRSMAAQIISQEAPIRDDVVARQIARAHGFARTGANIRDRILSILRDFPATDESTGRFLWNESGPQETIEFREAMGEEDKRAIDEISLSELRGLIRQNTDLLEQSDPAVAIARAIGVGRLAQSARERIAEAIDLERD
jgi:very-short-patch-repair endonuclease